VGTMLATNSVMTFAGPNIMAASPRFYRVITLP